MTVTTIKKSLNLDIQSRASTLPSTLLTVHTDGVDSRQALAPSVGCAPP